MNLKDWLVILRQGFERSNLTEATSSLARAAKGTSYLVVAVMLVAFALPASASNKLITLAVTPAELGSGGNTVEVFAKITNTGNSTANSFQIDYKVSEQGIFTVKSASVVGGSAGVAVGGLQNGYAGYVFTNQSPLARNQSVTIKLVVEVAGPRCASAWIDWFGYAWTGSPSSPSQSFRLTNGAQRTNSTAACSIRFGVQPADAFAGKKITGTARAEAGDVVTVELLQNGVVSSVSGQAVTVTGASNCATAAVTSSSNGVASLTSLTAGLSPATCVLTASAPGYGSVNSNSFQVLSLSGDLACGDEDAETGASLRRLFNATGEEGVDCTEIPYSLEFDGQTVTFLADYSVLPENVEPAFAFELPWRAEYVAVPAHLPIPYVANNNPPALGGTFVQAVPLSTHKFDDGDARFLLDFCPGQPQYDGNDVFTGLVLPVDFDASEGGDNDLSALPGFQYGCLIERKVEIVPDGESCPTSPDETGANAICVKVTETGYLRGDWTSTRTLR